MTVKRGEIYWVEFDPVKGSEQGGLRPALVVQNDIGNRYSPTTIVAAVTRTLPPKPYPFVVVFQPEESGLPQCGELLTIGNDSTNWRHEPLTSAARRIRCSPNRTIKPRQNA
jgi:mRNA interferase MazF